MAHSFVSPANRGLGLALGRHLLQTTKASVIATSRHDIEATRASLLRDLEDVDPDRLHVLQVDVTGQSHTLAISINIDNRTDEESIVAAANKTRSLLEAKDGHLRLSVINPGILHPEKSPSQIDANQVLATFKVNTIGPLLMIKHFAPFLPRKKQALTSVEGLPGHAVWATMSARVGSTTDNQLGGWYSYRASKAGVNSLTKTFDQYLKISSGDKAMAIALHPGTVKTGLSKQFWGNVKQEKLFSPEYAAEALVKVVRSLELEQGRGRCWDWKGEEIAP